MIRPINKKGALEMSVGTMVTLVLLMVFLVLAIFFIQKTINVGINAIDEIDNQIRGEVQKLFGEEKDLKLAMFPTSKRLSIEQGDNERGFALFIRNTGSESETFNFDITATDTSNCPESVTEEIATGYLIGKSGTMAIGSGDTRERLITFVIPETAPLCVIHYDVSVERASGEPYDGFNFALTIK